MVIQPYGNTGILAAIVCALALTAQAQTQMVVRLDFGEDNQAPKIGFVSGGTWNTIDDDESDPDVDIAVGTTTNLLEIGGSDSGITIGSWIGKGDIHADVTNMQDNDAYLGTVFNGAAGNAAWDVLNGGVNLVSFGFTLSGFNAGDSIRVQLGAASKKLWTSPNTNVVDFTFNGSYGDESGGDDFDVYANSQAGDGNGTILTWTLTGSTSYDFLMATDEISRGGINGMILTVTDAPSGMLFIVN